MKILHVIEGVQKAAGTSVFCGEVLNTLARNGNECRLLLCHVPLTLGMNFKFLKNNRCR